MPDPTATTTIPCPRCGTDISEAAAVRKAVAAERERIAGGLHERVDVLPVWDRRTVPGGKHVLRRLVHQEIDAVVRPEDKG